MESEKTKIEKLYENGKSRSFVNHLINAYLPLYKVNKVWTFEDKQSGHKCCVCGKKLTSIGEIYSAMHEKQEQFMTAFHDSIKKQLNGEETTIDDNPYIKVIGKDTVLAFTGEKTTTYLCNSCVKDLLALVQNAIFSGDKNISYQLNKMKREQLFNTFKKSQQLNESDINKVEEIQKKIEKAPQHKATFGDLSVLQELKKKMEEGNK